MRRGRTLGRTGLSMVLGLGLAAALAAGAQATPLSPHALPRPAVLQLAQNDDVSLEEAVRRVREDTGGRILAAETVQEDGRRVHRIRVLVEKGRVKTYRIDARDR